MFNNSIILAHDICSRFVRFKNIFCDAKVVLLNATCLNECDKTFYFDNRKLETGYFIEHFLEKIISAIPGN